MIIDHVAAKVITIGTEEMVKANIIKGGRRSKTGQVTTKIIARFVSTQHHRQCIPANQGADTTLHILITRHWWLLFN